MPKAFILPDYHDELAATLVSKFKDVVSDVKISSDMSGKLYSNIALTISPKKVKLDTLFGTETVTNPDMYSVIQGLGKIVVSSETNREFKIEAVWFPHDVLVKIKIRK